MMVVDAATANFRSSGTPYQLPANTNLYLLKLNDTTVVENHIKSLIHHCERSELRLLYV